MIGYIGSNIMWTWVAACCEEINMVENYALVKLEGR